MCFLCFVAMNDVYRSIQWNKSPNYNVYMRFALVRSTAGSPYSSDRHSFAIQSNDRQWNGRGTYINIQLSNLISRVSSVFGPGLAWAQFANGTLGYDNILPLEKSQNQQHLAWMKQLCVDTCTTLSLSLAVRARTDRVWFDILCISRAFNGPYINIYTVDDIRGNLYCIVDRNA